MKPPILKALIPLKLQMVPLFLAVILLVLGACKRADQGQSKEQGDATKTAAADAKNGVVLQAKWPIGNRYVYRLDLDQHSTNKIPQMPKPVQQDTLMSLTYALSVLKE